MKNSHLQRFINLNNNYLVEKLIEDVFILDVICFIYLCNKITSIDCIIMYFTSIEYRNNKSITHIKDVLKTLEYFSLVNKSGKIVRLDRKGIQIIEQKINITRASTTLDYGYLNLKGMFIISCLLKLQKAYNSKNIELDLIELCRLEEQSNLIKEDIIITPYNVVIIFNTLNINSTNIARKGETILKNKWINENKKITIMYDKNAYTIHEINLLKIFNQYNINYIKI